MNKFAIDLNSVVSESIKNLKFDPKTICFISIRTRRSQSQCEGLVSLLAIARYDVDKAPDVTPLPFPNLVPVILKGS